MISPNYFSNRFLAPRSSEKSGEYLSVDLNCDMGEGFPNDALIMPYISSANIACGYHAGDEQTIWHTIERAAKHGVAIGAHVSFHDKANFGRTEMRLPLPEIYELVEQQLLIFKEIADAFDLPVHHVKPHGALYNMAARDAAIANTIAQAVKDFDPTLILFGLSGSHSIHEAERLGLKTASEVFADRTYQDDGSLTPRSQTNALINDMDTAAQQAIRMVKQKTVLTTTGKAIPVEASTICIHGDGSRAADFARCIAEALQQQVITIGPPAK